eukprot:CAMPEP_0119095922 /NCGR_PEP_ID=MMETSP1178-20130426/171229_1 /TAXON_ID=33656 /ORGANISM="unid sp, Strain CCMP2000" /LENGTH=263 /DNA_ID=CAMNT_0007079775 /DNA_START=103 /DNA_END=894 /DNA_ORIENTATION=+
MSPIKSPSIIAMKSSAFGSQSELSEAGSVLSLTRPSSFPQMSSASDGGGSTQSINTLYDELGESDESDDSDGGEYQMMSAYRDQLALMSQSKTARARPGKDCASGCAALVRAAAVGVDAQWKVVAAATAELKAHWAAAEMQAATQAVQVATPQPTLTAVNSDAHLKAVVSAAVPQLRAHWAAPQPPKAYSAAEDEHLKAVVDKAVTEIKAHWATAAALEATPCCNQVLSADKDFEAAVTALVAEAQAHWAVSGELNKTHPALR